MELLCRALSTSLLTIGLTVSASAQDRQPDQVAPATAIHTPSLTGKERLGPKWTDEQRIDNCNVPLDQRGTHGPAPACLFRRYISTGASPKTLRLETPRRHADGRAARRPDHR